jgi:hypothetical protein
MDRGLNQEVRNTVVNNVRQHSSARSFEQYNVMILTAGFKPSIKATKNWGIPDGTSRSGTQNRNLER